MLTVEELREMNANFQPPADEGERTAAPVAPEAPAFFSNEHKDDLSQKLNDLISKYDRQSIRFKHVLEERDELSRQVSELRRMASNGDIAHGHDVGEEIRLLSKLMDEERGLYESARVNGSLPPEYNPYIRHNQFVDAFFSIVTRDK